MGANTFGSIGTGRTAKEAFDCLVDDDRYENGRDFTGSVGMKDSFVTIEVPPGEDPYAFAQRLINERDPRINDKWGPAGCVQVSERKWYFFGWSPS